MDRPVPGTAQAAEIGEGKMDEPAGNLEIARSYLQALERGETGAALKEFLAPDVVLDEFPNLLTPVDKRHDLGAALEGAELGKSSCPGRCIR